MAEPRQDRCIITNLLPNAFTEFGVDVTALLGTTRASRPSWARPELPSFTAELKDFTAPESFPICDAFITIEPDDVNAVGDPHTFTAR